MTLAVVASLTGGAFAAPGINFEEPTAPNPTVVEDELTVATHDMGEMDSPLQYYDDDGNLDRLPATVNQSQDTPVGVRFDQIEADAYTQFPRTTDESGNSANWTDATDYTTTSGASSSMTVTDADSNGVERVNFDASVASTETATATLADNVSITTDANKRVLFAVVNVNGLTSGSEVEIRAVDADGDYRSANITSSVNANADHAIANSTGDGYVFQQELSDLTLEGSGDGSFDEIQSVEVVVSESDADVTISGLDLDRKSERDLAEIQRDTDGDGTLETTVVTDYYEGGVANITNLSTLGSMYDDATIHDLHVYDVRYEYADLTDSEEYSTEFSSADDYSYPQQLELYGDLEVPSAIDLSHGALSLEFEQSLVGERYVVTEVAEGSDTDEAFGNLSDTDYTSFSSAIGSQNSTVTADATVSADTNYRVHMVVLLQDSEASALQAAGDGGGIFGPTDGSGGGFFSSTFGQIAGVAGAVLSALGLRRLLGSG